MIKRPNTLTIKLTRPNYKPQTFLSNKWAFGVSAVIGSAVILRDTFFAHSRRKWEEMKSNKDDTAIPVSENVLTLVQRAMKDLGFQDDEIKLVRVFTGTSFHSRTFGSTDTIFGAYLAVPAHFNSANSEVQSVQRFMNFFRERLSSDQITSLEGTLELSENAKLYSIARELTKARSCDTYVTQGLLASVFSCGSFFSYICLYRTILFGKPGIFKIPVFPICLLIGYLIYDASCSYVCACKDENAEQLVCCLGETYVAGGIEFCEKALQRKAILNEITEDASLYYEGLAPLSVMPYSDRLVLLKEKENCKR